MPSAVPYNHPSLVFGNIIDVKVLDIITAISSCQATIDAAQDNLNLLIMMRRSMKMTVNELMDMNVDVKPIEEKLTEIDAKITIAATEYLSMKITNEEAIQEQRHALSGISAKENCESPIDLTASKLTSRPYFSDSMRLDSQYFSFGSNTQDNTMANIEKFIRNNTAGAGSVNSDEVVRQVTGQVNNQVQNHSISGTLIIVANCTHCNIKMMDPLVIDPDKAILAWNSMFSRDKITTDSLKTAAPVDAPADTAAALSLITGASYGSSFIGMVHILNTGKNETRDYDKLKPELDEKVEMANWLSDAAGGFGVEKEAMNELKALLSTQSVSCHISLVTMGAVPSVKASELKLSLKMLSEGEKNSQPAVTQPAAPGGSSSLKPGADNSREKAATAHMQNTWTKNILHTMSEIDDRKDKVMDVSSLMTAFENYVEGIKSSHTNANANAGVPVSFFIKKLTKPEIMKLWRNKYLSESTSPPVQTNGKTQKTEAEKPAS